jgi:hypothetical protein
MGRTEWNKNFTAVSTSVSNPVINHLAGGKRLEKSINDLYLDSELSVPQQQITHCREATLEVYWSISHVLRAPTFSSNPQRKVLIPCHRGLYHGPPGFIARAHHCLNFSVNLCPTTSLFTIIFRGCLPQEGYSQAPWLVIVHWFLVHRVAQLKKYAPSQYSAWI